jgi:hypothetical protein
MRRKSNSYPSFSQIGGGHEPESHPSKPPKHNPPCPKHSGQLIYRPKQARIHLTINTQHDGFTRTLDAGTPSGYRCQYLHSRLEPSQLPELSTYARSTRWSHACSQARGRFPWRVCCLSPPLTPFYLAASLPFGFCLCHLYPSLTLHCRMMHILIECYNKTVSSDSSLELCSAAELCTTMSLTNTAFPTNCSPKTFT